SGPDHIRDGFGTAATAPCPSTLSLHDALPISITFACPECWVVSVTLSDNTRLPDIVTRGATVASNWGWTAGSSRPTPALAGPPRDRKSTRLNSSHVAISYAVFCLKKKTDTKSP